jgi:hypothetical protein
MSCIGQNVRILARQVLVEVLGVQDAGKLRSSILSIRAQILIELIERGELGVLGRSLVGVGGLIDDTDGIAILCRLLEQWE